MPITAEDILERLKKGAMMGIPPSLALPVDRQLDRYIEDAGLVLGSSSAVAFVALSHALTIFYPKEIAYNSSSVWQLNVSTSRQEVLLTDAGVNGMEPEFSFEKAFLRRVLVAINESPRWLLQLIACQQVSRLNNQKIVNFFKQHFDTAVNSDAICVILAIVRYAAHELPTKIMDDAYLRTLIDHHSGFVRYHTQFSATPRIANVGSTCRTERENMLQVCLTNCHQCQRALLGRECESFDSVEVGRYCSHLGAGLR